MRLFSVLQLIKICTCVSTVEPIDVHIFYLSALTSNVSVLSIGCVKANVSSGVASLADELAREEITHLTTVSNNLKARGLSAQCPLINIGDTHSVWLSAPAVNLQSSSLENMVLLGF